MKKFSKIALITLISCGLISCSKYASVNSLDNISVYMQKEDVMKKMGKKGIARGAMVNKFGQVIEVREYQIDRGKSGSQLSREITVTLLTLGLCSPILFSEGEIETYWLYFYNGQLVQWGKAGDWREAERKIYDINFNISYH